METSRAEPADISIAQPEGGQLVLRQINPAGCPIFAHVAQDVGELQRHAELDRVGDRLAARKADDVHGKKADGRSDAVAVGGQIIEGSVAGGRQVTRHPIDQLLGVCRRDTVARPRVGPRQHHQVIGLGRRNQGALLPGRQRRFRLVPRPVDDVIGDPAEGVQSPHRTPFLVRQKTSTLCRMSGPARGRSYRSTRRPDPGDERPASVPVPAGRIPTLLRPRPTNGVPMDVAVRSSPPPR